MIKINDTYSIIKGNDNPLSCDVAIIKDKYIFEVGNGDYIVDELSKIVNPIVFVSHFHQDHLTNISKIKYKELYIGDNTYKYTNSGEIIDDLYIEDGVKLHLFKISLCHAKGSIGMEIGDYAFIGDANAPAFKNGHYVYNVQMLKEEIEQLSSLKANYIVFSHHMERPVTKTDVIKKLQDIYNNREKNNPYIQVDK